jgi:predicted transcriptional regulator
MAQNSQTYRSSITAEDLRHNVNRLRQVAAADQGPAGAQAERMADQFEALAKLKEAQSANS